MSRVVLHIGLEKTGTTAIQRFLAMNSGELLKSGVWAGKWQGSSNHHVLAAYAVDPMPEQDIHKWHGVRPDTFDAFRSLIEREMAELAQSADMVVFSSEHLSSRVVSKGHIARIRQLFDRVAQDITVVVFLRRQARMIEATYSTALKAGHSHIFDLRKAIAQRMRYDFLMLFERWNEAFPNRVVPVGYREGGSASEDWIYREFCRVAGLPWESGYRTPMEPMNRSLDPNSLSFLRIVNAAAGDNPEMQRLRPRLIRNLELSGNHERFTLGSADEEHVFRAYQESNERLCNLLNDPAITKALLGHDVGLHAGNPIPISPPACELERLVAALVGTMT